MVDIDPDRMTLRVEQGKGPKDRDVPLSIRLLGQLRQYWAQSVRGPDGDTPIDPTTAQRGYWTAKRRVGITKPGGIHALRHAFATHQAVAQAIRQRQHPLAHRHPWQHFVDERGGAFGHAAPAS